MTVPVGMGGVSWWRERGRWCVAQVSSWNERAQTVHDKQQQSECMYMGAACPSALRLSRFRRRLFFRCAPQHFRKLSVQAVLACGDRPRGQAATGTTKHRKRLLQARKSTTHTASCQIGVRVLSPFVPCFFSRERRGGMRRRPFLGRRIVNIMRRRRGSKGW